MDSHDALHSDEITRVLRELRDRPQLLRERLFPLLYDPMKKIARGQMRAERHARTLQPTALVHEAYLRLARSEPDWESRTQFLACAANVMREILVEHARKRIAYKRGAGAEHIALDEFAAAKPVSFEDILTADIALDRLRQVDYIKAELLQMKFFGGLTMEECSSALGIGLTTTKQHYRLAKAWLSRELSKKNSP